MYKISYMCACGLSYLWLFATQWTVALQAPLSMKLSRQEYWSGSPFHPARDRPEIVQGSSPYLLCLLHWQTGSLPPAPRKPHVSFCYKAKELSYTYTCIHSFLDSFPIKVTAEYWVEFPVPSRGSLLVICCRCSRVCLSRSVFGQHLPGPVQVGAALLSWGGRTFSAWPPGGTVTAASRCLVRVGPARNHSKVLLTAGPQGNPREFHLNAQPVPHCSQREIK